MDYQVNFKELLDHIDPAACSYSEWAQVGMALQYEGESVELWDEWSRRDYRRYHEGECETKWRTFGERNAASPVTGATITQMAKENGYVFTRAADEELGWNATITADAPEDCVVVQKGWIEGQDIHEPSDNAWDPINDLSVYLSTLYDSDDVVGYVTQTYTNSEGKSYPSAGSYTKTAGKLLSDLAKCKGDITNAIEDYSAEAGAWIRFNPLDGKGVKNANVTEFRYALVECDDMGIPEQNAVIRQLELPVACLVFSGKKSLHAIVHIDAGDAAEYRKRVEYLYAVCKKNGLKIDEQNKNPSRLSRMPGVTRNGRKQFLVATKIGKANFAEWQEWIEAVNDDLPDIEKTVDVMANLPPLAAPLIEGIVRQGDKMLLAGPSKAGKSFLLIELAISIAEGRPWLGFKCAQGPVLYVNLELNRASCLHRINDIYKALNLPMANLPNLDVWNLRGKSLPMDKLAPKLIRRAQKKGYIAIIIDPIYKIITGDENSADQMAHFCNQFDKVCTELGCSVIYCHHHSKGVQGNKRSMDRASGSGVFARDPDALLDLIELAAKDDKPLKEGPQEPVPDAKQSAWRIEGTLREFAEFEPVNMWFQYPVHVVDTGGMLKMAATADAEPSWQAKRETINNGRKEAKAANIEAMKNAIGDAPKDIKIIAEQVGISEKTARRYAKESGEFVFKNGLIWICDVNGQTE